MVTTRRSKTNSVADKEDVPPPPAVQQQLKETQVLTTSKSPHRTTPLTSRDVQSFPLPDDDDDDQADVPDHKNAMHNDKTAIKRSKASGSGTKLLFMLNLSLIVLVAVAFMALAPILPSSLPHFCSSLIPPLTQASSQRHPLNSLINPSLRPTAMKTCESLESKLSATYSVVLREARLLGSKLTSQAAKALDSKIVVPFIPPMSGQQVTVGDILSSAVAHIQSVISSVIDAVKPKEPTFPTSTAWLQHVMRAFDGYDNAWDALASDAFAKKKAFVILLSCPDEGCGQVLAERMIHSAKKFEMSLYNNITDEESYQKISCTGLFHGSSIRNDGESGAELQKVLSDFILKRCPASLHASPFVVFDDPDKIRSLKAIQVLNNLLSESGGLTYDAESVGVRTGSIFVFTMSTAGSKLKESDPKAILSARLMATLRPKPFHPSPEATEIEIEEGKAQYERSREAVKATVLGLRRRIDATN